MRSLRNTLLTHIVTVASNLPRGHRGRCNQPGEARRGDRARDRLHPSTRILGGSPRDARGYGYLLTCNPQRGSDGTCVYVCARARELVGDGSRSGGMSVVRMCMSGYHGSVSQSRKRRVTREHTANETFRREIGRATVASRLVPSRAAPPLGSTRLDSAGFDSARTLRGAT